MQRDTTITATFIINGEEVVETNLSYEGMVGDIASQAWRMGAISVSWTKDGETRPLTP